MKKRVLALILCAATAFNLTACGSKGEAAEATEAVENTESTQDDAVAVNLAKYDLNGEDYVTLCDYSEIPVTISGDYDVTDNDVLDYVEQIFTQGGPFYTADPSKTKVEEGDIVNVDYVGKLDGEAFEGGSAENQNIDVYANASAGGTGYIDGFTDALKGASVGDVIDADVTFPENYGNADLAGKEVVFTFTVNSIQKEVTVDTMDDKFASEQFGAESVDEVYEQVRQYLESSASSTHRNDIYSALEDYLLDNCKVDMPADYRADVLEAIHQNFIETYCNGDEDQMESVVTSYGQTVENLEKEWTDNVEGSIKLELIVKAIAAKEGIEVDDTEFENYVNTIVSNSGYGDADTLYSNYGYGDAVYGKSQIRVIYLAGLVLDKLAETAIVTENAVEETNGTEETETTEEAETTEE